MKGKKPLVHPLRPPSLPHQAFSAYTVPIPHPSLTGTALPSATYRPLSYRSFSPAPHSATHPAHPTPTCHRHCSLYLCIASARYTLPTPHSAHPTPTCHRYCAFHLRIGSAEYTLPIPHYSLASTVLTGATDGSVVGPGPALGLRHHGVHKLAELRIGRRIGFNCVQLAQQALLSRQL